jgi:hypothetical protein
MCIAAAFLRHSTLSAPTVFVVLPNICDLHTRRFAIEASTVGQQDSNTRKIVVVQVV